MLWLSERGIVHSGMGRIDCARIESNFLRKKRGPAVLGFHVE